MADRHYKATVGDSKWSGKKQRCYSLLVEWVGGEHHLGKLSHFGGGLRMTTWEDVASFDGDLLTRLVILAHKHRCRVAIGPAGPSYLAIQVWAREVSGGLTVRHPELRDLIEECKRHEPVNIDKPDDTEGGE